MIYSLLLSAEDQALSSSALHLSLFVGPRIGEDLYEGMTSAKMRIKDRLPIFLKVCFTLHLVFLGNCLDGCRVHNCGIPYRVKTSTQVLPGLNLTTLSLQHCFIVNEIARW